MQNLRILSAALANRWRLIAIVFVLVTTAVTAGVYLRTPVFESQAAVLLNVERFGVSVSRADVRQDVAVLQAVEAVTSQAEVLRSKDLIERTLDTLDPNVFKGAPPRNPIVAAIVSAIDSAKNHVSEILRELRLLPPSNERYAMVKEIEDNLKVSTVRQAQVIRIVFSASNPDTARLVLQRMLDLYVKRAADNTLESEGGGALTNQANAVGEKLDAAEQELFVLRARYNIADFAAEKATLSERINRLTTVIESGTAAPQSSVSAASTKAAPADGRSVVEVSANDAASSAVGAQVVQLRSQLSELRVSRVALLSNLSSEHPRLHSIDQQIASVEALLRQEVSAMKDTIASYRARLNILISVEPQLLRLQRKAASFSESYDVYRKTAEDRRLMREQEARLQIQIIDPPSLAYMPRGPVPAVLVAAGALFGLLSGFGLAILLTYLRGPVERIALIESAVPIEPPEPMEPTRPVEPTQPTRLSGPSVAAAD